MGRAPSRPRVAFRLGEWVVEPSLNQVTKGTHVAHLRPLTMDLLVLLADHPGQVVSKDEILRDVWQSKYVDESVLARSVGDLRRLFGSEARRSEVIETIPKRGYRLLAQVAPLAAGPQQGAPNTVAVLPFVDLAGEGHQDYLCNGLAEELIHGLARVPGLRVVARTSAFAFKNRPMDVRDIGRLLNAGTIVEGGLRRDGDRLRITVQLVDAETGYHLWSERFERTLDRVFTLEDEIAAAIASKLTAQLVAPPGLAKAFTSDQEAFTLCLKARYHHSRQTTDDLRLARDLFEHAAARDPRCAQAYAGIAASCWDGVQYGFSSNADDLVRGRWAAGRAVDMDPTYADGKAMLGVFLGAFDYEWAQAEVEFEAALELAPTSPAVRERYAMYWLQPHGRFDEAIRHLTDALAFDPLSALLHTQLGHVHLLRRAYEPACHHFSRARELDPNHVLALGGHAMALGLLGRVGEAFAVAQTMTPEFIQSNPLFLGASGATLAAAGRVAEARAALQMLTDDARFPRKSCYSIAWVHLALGEIDEAFRWLARGVEERDPKFVFLPNKPFWDPLRADPRFDRLLRRMNLAI
jgi:TolB-like protein/Tfp pilus assembly protein PilF